MFSKACEYGIKAAIFIAINSYEGRRVSPKEIAEEINSPQAFTAKILQDLVRNNIVFSIKVLWCTETLLFLLRGL